MNWLDRLMDDCMHELEIERQQARLLRAAARKAIGETAKLHQRADVKFHQQIYKNMLAERSDEQKSRIEQERMRKALGQK